MPERPTGTVTFLFTDLEGSTRLWEEHPEAMRDALKRHDELLIRAVEAHRGYVVKTTGDGVHAAFATADAAVAAAIEGQRALDTEGWGTTGPLKVRMGIHSGGAQLRDGDYYGPALNRAARLMDIAHGGQIVTSSVTAELVRDELPAAIEIRDLGQHRLRDLGRAERVYQVVIPELPTEFAPLRSLDIRRTNLPVQVTSFVGRDHEVLAITQLLAGHRLVTLTGTGGVGKTRLAMQVAAESLEHYPDGVWLVELATVEVSRVLDVLAAKLEIDVLPRMTTESSLLDALRGRHLLLVLDNCEHVVGEVRRIIELVLRESVDVTILATSREALRVTGEHVYSVPSLDDQSAVRLFAERAGAVDANFVLRPEQAATLGGVCARLDGIPLAIELAAARITMFNIEELALRLDRRFQLLTGGGSSIERHQTLRAAIDWSYNLLGTEEQVVFERLSVFDGGCTLEAAEAIIADADLEAGRVLEVLSGLIDKSLITADRGEVPTRYRMSETIRQYAQERLVETGQAEEASRRHAVWYAAFARASGRGLYSSDEKEWLARLQHEMENLLAAVLWAVSAAETDLAMRIAGAFPRQASARPLLGTVHLAEEAMRVAGANEHPVRARVMAEAAWGRIVNGDGRAASEVLFEALEAQRHGARFAVAAYLYLLYGTAWHIGEYEPFGSAYDIATEGLAMAERAGDAVAATGLRSALAVQAMLTGREDEGREQSERALAEARELVQPTLEAAALYATALARSRTDPRRAITLLHEAIDLARQIGNDAERGQALGLLAALEAQHGDVRRALDAMRDEVLARIQRTSYITAPTAYYGVQVFNRLGRPDLVALCEGNAEHTKVSAPLFYEQSHHDAVREARATLGLEAFGRHLAEGRAMSLEDHATRILKEIDGLLATT